MIVLYVVKLYYFSMRLNVMFEAIESRGFLMISFAILVYYYLYLHKCVKYIMLKSTFILESLL